MLALLAALMAASLALLAKHVGITRRACYFQFFDLAWIVVQQVNAQSLLMPRRKLSRRRRLRMRCTCLGKLDMDANAMLLESIFWAWPRKGTYHVQVALVLRNWSRWHLCCFAAQSPYDGDDLAGHPFEGSAQHIQTPRDNWHAQGMLITRVTQVPATVAAVAGVQT